MAAVIGALRAELSASIAQFNDDLGKAAQSLAGFRAKASSIASGLTSVGTRMALAITAPIVLMAKASADQATEMRDAMGQVNAALESTGGTSGKTAKQLEDLASQLEDISTFDKSSILRGVTATLLQFGNISGPTFDRAEKAVVNLSSRLGIDLQSAALKLGRALNDPIGALNALSRLGVQFTKQEQDQIVTLVRAGKGYTALDIILAKIEQKFDGAALAMRRASPTAELQQAWRNLKETIGTLLLQVLPPFTKALADVIKRFQELTPESQRLVVQLAAAAAVAGPLFTVLGGAVKVVGTLVPVFASLGSVVRLVSALLPLLAGELAPLLAVFAAVALAIGAVVALVWPFRDQIAKAFRDAWDAASTYLGDDFRQLMFDVGNAFADLSTTVKKDAPELSDLFSKIGKALSEAFSWAVKESIEIVGGALDFLLKVVDRTIAGIMHALSATLAFISGDWKRAWAEAGKIVDDAFGRNPKAPAPPTPPPPAPKPAAKPATPEAKRPTPHFNLGEPVVDKAAEAMRRLRGEVNANQIAIDRFARGGLDPLQERLIAVDDTYQALHDKIVDQIAANKELAAHNKGAADSVKRLQDQLVQLDTAHKAATAAAVAQYKAEELIADLRTKAANLETASAIQDLRQARGQNSPISSMQEELQATARDLAKTQLDAEIKLQELIAQRAEAVRANDDAEVQRLDSQISLQEELYNLVSQTTAEQLDGAKRVNEAFKSFTDSLSSSLSDMIMNWSFDLKGLMGVFRQLAQQMFVKPMTESIAGGLSGLLKDLGASFAGAFAGGGTLSPGKWAIAGENGPEPIWAGGSHLNVMSNEDANTLGRGGGVVQNFNISTPDANSFRRTQRQIGRMAKQRLSL